MLVVSDSDALKLYLLGLANEVKNALRFICHWRGSLNAWAYVMASTRNRGPRVDTVICMKTYRDHDNKGGYVERKGGGKHGWNVFNVVHKPIVFRGSDDWIQQVIPPKQGLHINLTTHLKKAVLVCLTLVKIISWTARIQSQWQA